MSGREKSRLPHLGSGLVKGAHELTMCLIGGVSGTVMEPYRGFINSQMKTNATSKAKAYGIGVGRAVFGLAFVPAGGALGFTSAVLKGVINTPRHFIKKLKLSNYAQIDPHSDIFYEVIQSYSILVQGRDSVRGRSISTATIIPDLDATLLQPADIGLAAQEP